MSGVARLAALVVVAATLAPASAASPAADCQLDEARAPRAGRPRARAGGGARDWVGSPSVDAAPFLLPHLPVVLAHPGRLLELGSTLLTVAPLSADGGVAGGPLFGALTVLALQPRSDASRGFRQGLVLAQPAPGLLTALLAAGAVQPRFATGPVDLLRPLAGPDSLPAPGAAELALPQELRAPVAVLLEAALRAAAWVELSWRELPPELVAEAVADRELSRTLASGERWWPALDRAARHGDDEARAYAASLLAVAVETVVATPPSTPLAFSGWEAVTAAGRVVVLGPGADQLACADDCLLVLDLGGDDSYLGSAGAARWPRQAVSVLVDTGGDDSYRQGEAPLAQGAGQGAVGLLVDLAGNDVYLGATSCQGHGLLGYGLLWDVAGDDRFQAVAAAQGAALFGAGLLLDRAGDDRYELHGEGQGFGGPDAVGVLADLAGDDHYLADPDPAVAGRADPHTDGRVAASNAQGAGVGRRGDLGNGHAWAGGLGLLVDGAGSDRYRCGTFCQGLGYWYGTGLLLDGAGSDHYRSVYFSQGAALHQGAGLLLDRSGDDLHWLEDVAGASLGYAWDVALGLFVDGGGDDLYRLTGTGLGAGERRAVGLFLDAAGCDTYDAPRQGPALGHVDRLKDDVPGLVTATRRAAQAGLFLDLGGDDVLPRTTGLWFEKGGHLDRRPLNLGAGVDLAGPGCSLADVVAGLAAD